AGAAAQRLARALLGGLVGRQRSSFRIAGRRRVVPPPSGVDGVQGPTIPADSSLWMRVSAGSPMAERRAQARRVRSAAARALGAALLARGAPRRAAGAGAREPAAAASAEAAPADAPGADLIERAWLAPADSLEERTQRTRRAALEAGVWSLDPVARALLVGG